MELDDTAVSDVVVRRQGRVRHALETVMARVKRRWIEFRCTECRATFDGGRCTVQVGQSRIFGLVGREDPAVLGHEILVCLTRVLQA